VRTAVLIRPAKNQLPCGGLWRRGAGAGNCRRVQEIAPSAHYLVLILAVTTYGTRSRAACSCFPVVDHREHRAA
jgi:hypothetical protein